VKIISVEKLPIPDVVALRFARFPDDRGYFSESFRASDVERAAPGLAGARFIQANESFSKKGVARGLHFQWDPPQGKLVRTVRGRMIDLALDIRKGSPTAGRVVARDMPRREGDAEGEWIWLPPGFAHGVVFLEDTTIEYLCTAEWNPSGEGGISPLAEDLDWSLCDPAAGELARRALAAGPLMSDKDRRGPSFKGWMADPRSAAFAWKGA
jgi:dTDP-4-dehydrorhamnose 3,5-epimerase